MVTLFGINAAGWFGLLLAAALFVGMLMNGLKNQPKRQAVRYLDETERALRILEAQWEAGKISASEYRARKTALLFRYR